METTLFALKAYYLGIQYLCCIRTAWPKIFPSLRASALGRQNGVREAEERQTERERSAHDAINPALRKQADTIPLQLLTEKCDSLFLPGNASLPSQDPKK